MLQGSAFAQINIILQNLLHISTKFKNFIIFIIIKYVSTARQNKFIGISPLILNEKILYEVLENEIVLVISYPVNQNYRKREGFLLIIICLDIIQQGNKWCYACTMSYHYQRHANLYLIAIIFIFIYYVLFLGKLYDSVDIAKLALYVKLVLGQIWLTQ